MTYWDHEKKFEANLGNFVQEITDTLREMKMSIQSVDSSVSSISAPVSTMSNSIDLVQQRLAETNMVFNALADRLVERMDTEAFTVVLERNAALTKRVAELEEALASNTKNSNGARPLQEEGNSGSTTSSLPERGEDDANPQHQ